MADKKLHKIPVLSLKVTKKMRLVRVVQAIGSDGICYTPGMFVWISPYVPSNKKWLENGVLQEVDFTDPNERGDSNNEESESKSDDTKDSSGKTADSGDSTQETENEQEPVSNAESE